jgi:hypothetical protein
MALTNLISPLLWQSIPFTPENERTKGYDAWTDFLGFHDQWHRVIAVTLGQGSRWVVLDDLKAQGTVHQAMHDLIADTLKIPRGGDIASANLENKDEFTNWQFVHALDHQRFRLVLGI